MEKWKNGKMERKKNYLVKAKKKAQMIIGLTLFVIMVIVLILIIQSAPSNTNSNNVEISTNAISRARLLDNEFVTVTLQGGLGNQMFQIATAMAYAEKTNKKFIMDINISELVGLSIRKTYWNKIHVEHDDKIDTYNWKEIKEANFAFNDLPIEPGNVKLTGYFQSARYFEDQRNAIVGKFVMCNHVTRKDTISIHIRRTDYIGLNFYAELNKEYFQAAIQYVQSFYSQHLTLVIFSDDLDWVKKSGWFSDFQVQFYDEPGDYEQLIAMSQCEHHVMANSSYSWWAVYLGNQTGITVAPKQWFLDSNINTNDLYLPNWIKM
jgi:hypothetical protein